MTESIIISGRNRAQCNLPGTNQGNPFADQRVIYSRLPRHVQVCGGCSIACWSTTQLNPLVQYAVWDLSRTRSVHSWAFIRKFHFAGLRTPGCHLRLASRCRTQQPHRCVGSLLPVLSLPLDRLHCSWIAGSTPSVSHRQKEILSCVLYIPMYPGQRRACCTRYST